jgi:hypothetical protein
MDTIKISGNKVVVSVNVSSTVPKRKAWGSSAIKRLENLKKSKSRIKDIVRCNVEKFSSFRSKFITLTFAKDISLRLAKEYFRQFIKRLNNFLGFHLAYLCVYEYTKRGRPHFHLIGFNMPYLKNLVLAKIWGKGFVRINVISGLNGAVKYVSKYLTKLDFRMLQDVGSRIYTTSRNLARPVIFRLDGWTDFVLKFFKKYLFYTFSFSNLSYSRQTSVYIFLDVSKGVIDDFKEFFKGSSCKYLA